MWNGPALAQSHTSPPSSEVRRIELGTRPAPAPAEIFVRPGGTTVLLFDTPLARDAVTLEERERFHRVVLAEDTLVLLPSDKLQEGTRLRLTLRYEDGSTPREASFLLVVTPGHFDAQVEIVSASPSVRDEPSKTAQLQGELLRLREENARLRAEKGPTGLTGLLAAGLIDEQGLLGDTLGRDLPTAPSILSHDIQAQAFRSISRVAVAIVLTSAGGHSPWTASRATLTDAMGRRARELRVWQSKPLTQGDTEVLLVLETEASSRELQGTYTLELRDEKDSRALILRPVRFPRM
ncbi:DUF2381 family protein [Myxococcus qinghaiensis]|uniref:DUF2381 family protein n=1 Tax=Myxococcus qinghaiensis TaxID=2906758 RepID=UPI0020A73C6B|nr:DUF2381 family protein [Myxococcus qinghaiensis]MCP3169079.1 DUF2381 family protein [Myxococcus qinghaiensis]